MRRSGWWKLAPGRRKKALPMPHYIYFHRQYQEYIRCRRQGYDATAAARCDKALILCARYALPEAILALWFLYDIFAARCHSRFIFVDNMPRDTMLTLPLAVPGASFLAAYRRVLKTVYIISVFATWECLWALFMKSRWWCADDLELLLDARVIYMKYTSI